MTVTEKYPMRPYGHYMSERSPMLVQAMAPVAQVKPPYWELWFDGGAQDNGRKQCRGRWAFMVRDGRGTIFELGGEACGSPVTVNTAEYQGLCSGLEWIVQAGGCPGLKIFGDSKLVITQVNGRWQARGSLAQWRDRCWDLLEVIPGLWSACWRPRHLNGRCDALVKGGYAA